METGIEHPSPPLKIGLKYSEKLCLIPQALPRLFHVYFPNVHLNTSESLISLHVTSSRKMVGVMHIDVRPSKFCILLFGIQYEQCNYSQFSSRQTSSGPAPTTW